MLATVAVDAPARPFALDDQRAGMTCEYYDAGARLAWSRKGGDWVDADGVAYGAKPVATRRIVEGEGGSSMEWDVTALAKAWGAGARPDGGIFLRQQAGAKSSVQFGSRETVQTARRPRLEVSWSDGRRSEWAPIADATMTCTSLSGKGDDDDLQVGMGRDVALVFPFQPRADAVPTSARLVLARGKQFGPPSEVAAFRLDAPFATAQPLQQGLASGFTQDKDIERHPSVVFATGFEARGWQRDWSDLSSSSNADSVDADGNGFQALAGRALRVTVDKGKKTGLNLLYRFKDKLGQEPEAMYFRYYLRLGENWLPAVEGKLPGFAGTYGRAGWGGRQSDGEDGWSARGRYSLSASIGRGRAGLGSYVYHADMNKRYGDGWGWNLGETGIIERNRWYSVEQYIKLNAPGREDGVLRAWVDGRLVFEKTGLRFRDTSDLRIETVWMNVYHGGTKPAPADLSLYIDNVVVAREYIGPSGPSAQASSR